MIPVHLLTGFLGAGKTTLLNRLVAGRRDTALVVNEFGAVAVDHHLVRRGREMPVVTSTGCICCTRGSDLRASLAELLHGRQQGDLPEFSRVIVETTGLADPAPIINSLIPGGLPAMALRDHAVARNFRLATVIAVLNATMPPEMLTAHPESLRQLAFADEVVLTHTDLAPVSDWLGRLRDINPAARLHDAADPGFDPQALLGSDSYSGLGRSDAVAGWLAAAAAGGENRHDGVATLVLSGGRSRDRAGWQSWLDDLARQRGLLRAKGLIAMPGASGPLLAHIVGHRAYPLQPLEAWPPGLLPETRLVVIGDGLDTAALRRSFAEVSGALPGLGG